MNEKPGKNADYRVQRLNLGVGMALGFEFVGAVFLFWFLGRVLDGWLGIEPWGQVVGSVVGWVGGTLHVYYAVQRRVGESSR